MSAEHVSFERQVALFLGGMADEVALGPRTPPRPMLRRARLHMAASVMAAGLILAVAAVLGTLVTHGLLGGHGPLNTHGQTGGSPGSTDGSRR